MAKDATTNNQVNHQSDIFTIPVTYSLDHDQLNPNISRQEHIVPENSIEMVDYMLCNPSQISLDKLSFAEVMQFADFGPKLALNHAKIPDEDDINYFLRQPEALMAPPLPRLPQHDELEREQEEQDEQEEEVIFSDSNANTSTPPIQFLNGLQKAASETKGRRKRPRSLKTTEEVESQRMTHIAVERNRRRQMNDHLRVLKSLMHGSNYVQRGDQASIIGGAIEFVRGLEQLLECLESQKRRRLFGGNEPPRPMTADPSALPTNQQFFPTLQDVVNDHHMKILELDPSGLAEEMAENKSSIADIEVRLLAFDAMITILCMRKPEQLLKIINALEDLQLNILHTNITTIEQTVLYSFNVKIIAETRYSAEDIANSVQQILGFIDANTI